MVLLSAVSNDGRRDRAGEKEESEVSGNSGKSGGLGWFSVIVFLAIAVGFAVMVLSR